MPLLDHFYAPVSERRSWLAADATTYAVAYRPSRKTSGDQIELWSHPLQLGEPLSVLPLALRNAGVVPVDLEETYEETRQRSRLG